MIILFSPSEEKIQNIEGKCLNIKDFYFKKDEKLLKAYNDFLKNSSIEEKQGLFGSKKSFDISIFSSPTLEAIELYSGVAFKELDFTSLEKKAKDFCKENVIIFSNLFGPVFGGEKLPFYKLKQGKSFSFYKIAAHYKALNKNELDNFLKDEEIIDLRASYYESFYPLDLPHTKLIFRKNGKALSHNVKKTRGLLLKRLSSLKNLEKALLSFNPLSIKKSKLKNACVYELDLA